MSEAGASGSLPPEVKRIAVVVILGAIMSILDTTIVNVALETLRVDLDAPLSTIQWVSTGYLLALATVIPLTGWAAERLGPKRVWMSAVVAFVLTSALCGLAWSAESLIVFRVLQGLAGGMIMPIGMITLAQAAGPARMGRVMSVVGVPMVLAPVVGPALGGLLIDNVSWRWIFYVNVPVGIVGLVLAARLMPATRATGLASAGGDAGPVRLDWRGLLMGSPGIALIVFGLSEYGTKASVGATTVWLPFVVGLVMVCAFVAYALRVRYPLVDIRLFKGAGFSAAAGTVTLVGIALFGAMILLPLYYQLARGESPLDAGLLLMPQGLGAAIGMRIGGRLTDRIGAGRVVIGGLLILAVGTIPFAGVDAHTSYWLLGGGLLLRGIGLGGSMMPSMAGAYATLRTEQVPRATPMLNVMQRVGGSFGAAILTVILQNRITHNLSGAGVKVPGGGDALGGTTLPAAVRARVAEPIAHAFGFAYGWSLALIVVALIPATILAVAEHRARRDAATPTPAPPEEHAAAAA